VTTEAQVITAVCPVDRVQNAAATTMAPENIVAWMEEPDPTVTASTEDQAIIAA
jgi:hypothetical protein